MVDFLGALAHGAIEFVGKILLLFVGVGIPLYVIGALWRRLTGQEPALPTPEQFAAERRVAERMRRLRRPTLLLIPAREPGFSKLGGDPELPADLNWPDAEVGSRTFVAQIDLAAFRPHVDLGWLPTDGRIYAFYDPERHGCADVVRILYTCEAAGPAITPRLGVARRFPERRVGFMAFTSAPSLDWLNVDYETLSHDTDNWPDHDRIADAPPPDELQHRIGGYPNEIQMECMPLACEHLARGLPDPRYGEEPPPEVARAARQWRMLLQIDSDPALKMNWGDGRTPAGDFSKTVSLWQTH